jgi:CBS-domain-containing membrane protein
MEVGVEPTVRVGQRPFTRRDWAISACVTSAVVHGFLVREHSSEPLLATSFALAAVALALLAYVLTRPEFSWPPGAAAALFAALLVAYPAVTLLNGERFDALGIATKAVEALGLGAAVTIRGESRSFGSADVVVGLLVALLLLSLGHSH